jgi:hypothetical protein
MIKTTDRKRDILKKGTKKEKLEREGGGMNNTEGVFSLPSVTWTQLYFS